MSLFSTFVRQPDQRFAAASVGATVAFVTLVVAGVAAPGQLGAQGSRPYAPVVLELPIGARSLAMGDVGVASRDDDVLFYNPAQLAVARGMSASAERYSPTAGGGTLSAVTRFNGGGIAVGMRMADYDAPANFFPVNRGSMLDDGPAAGTSLEASVGLAQVFKGLRVGAAATYAEDEVSTVRAGRAAFDVGLSKDVFRNYTVGLAVQNIGRSIAIPCNAGAGCAVLTPPGGDPGVTPLTQADLPLRTTLGISGSHEVGAFDLVATGALSLLRKDFLIPAAGAELGYSWLDGYEIALRAGARRGLPGEGTLTAGAGFTADRVSFDYALETLAGARLGHRFGIRVR